MDEMTPWEQFNKCCICGNQLSNEEMQGMCVYTQRGRCWKELCQQRAKEYSDKKERLRQEINQRTAAMYDAIDREFITYGQ